MPRLFATLLVAATLLLCSTTGFAQDTATPPPVQSKPDVPAPPPGDRVELDQTVVNVQTTLALKRHKSYFKITHRFARDLRRGSFGQLAEDGFGTDLGAIIGLEYRYGITSNLQAGVHRSILGKTIETFGKWDVRPGDGRPFGLSLIASVEGQNNLHLDPQPGIGASLSHVHGNWLAVYANPTYIHNAHTASLRLEHEGHNHGGTTPDPNAEAEIPGEDHHDTAFIGLGTRVRLRETVTFVAEASPRIYGYRPDRAAWNVGIEKLTRGHVLQLNFGNNYDSTAGMVARGGSPHDVYMGFNLSRKF